MMNNSIRLGRLAGIEIKLDYSWFVLFLIVTWSLAVHYFPDIQPGWSAATYWLIGIVTSLLFFASVLTHEMAHSIVSRLQGVPVRDITLFIFGGAARISQEPRRPRDEFLMAVVGPVMSLALALGFGLLWWLSRAADTPFHVLTGWLSGTNFALAVFNMIPGFPLDGGRVFRAIVWSVTGNLRRATRIACTVGRVVAFAFIVFGIWQILTGNWANGIWIAFIGWFLDNAASQSYRQLELEQALAGKQVREVMSPCPAVAGGLKLDEVVDRAVLPSGERCFAVLAEGRLVGLLTLRRVTAVPRDEWSLTRVDEVMIPLDTLHMVQPTDDLAAVFHTMTAENIDLLPVVEGGQPVGVVSRDAFSRFMHVRGTPGWRHRHAA